MDIALKQRLVGASVLVALAVVVLPMLLGGRPESGVQETQTIELPPQPSELDFQTRRYPIGETPSVPQRAPEEAPSGDATATLPQPQRSPESSPRAETAEEAGHDAGRDAEGTDKRGAVAHVELEPREFQDALPDDTVPATVAADREAAPEPSAAKVTVPAAASGGGRYVVQVASFGSTDNAKRLSETLRGSGYAVLSDTVTSDVGTLHRVRVGPYASEAEASAAAARLRQQVSDVKPRVVDLQPEKAAQVTTPSDPLVRWVVQLGSFSSTANADSLVERVRAEGFSAFKESISSSGSTIYRVRVGPFLDRDEAIRVDGLIAERLAVDGVVMSAD